MTTHKLSIGLTVVIIKDEQYEKMRNAILAFGTDVYDENDQGDAETGPHAPPFMHTVLGALSTNRHHHDAVWLTDHTAPHMDNDVAFIGETHGKEFIDDICF